MGLACEKKYSPNRKKALKMSYEELYRLYQSGKTCEQLARIKDCTGQALWHGFKTRGYKLRPKGRHRPDEQVEQMFRLRAEGLAWDEIGKRFGISGPAVWQLCDRRKPANK